MILIGGGGHARVIADLCRKSGQTVQAIFDDDPAKHHSRIFETPVVGAISSEKIDKPAFLAIGDNRTRRNLSETLHPPEWKTLIHPTAIVADDVEIGEGTVIMAGAIIQTGSRIGRHAIVNTGACIDHDCRIGDFCHIGPNCSFGGEIRVDDGGWIGLGSTVINKIAIGKWSVIGAGSTVTDNIPEEVKAVGSPAKIIN